VELEREERSRSSDENIADNGGQDGWEPMTRVYASVALGLSLQVMSVASLLSLSFSNPGYVSDYFVSERVLRGPTQLSEEEENNSHMNGSGSSATTRSIVEQYDIYKKEDYLPTIGDGEQQ